MIYPVFTGQASYTDGWLRVSAGPVSWFLYCTPDLIYASFYLLKNDPVTHELHVIKKEGSYNKLVIIHYTTPLDKFWKIASR